MLWRRRGYRRATSKEQICPMLFQYYALPSLSICLRLSVGRHASFISWRPHTYAHCFGESYPLVCWEPFWYCNTFWWIPIMNLTPKTTSGRENNDNALSYEICHNHHSEKKGIHLIKLFSNQVSSDRSKGARQNAGWLGAKRRSWEPVARGGYLE